MVATLVSLAREIKMVRVFTLMNYMSVLSYINFGVMYIHEYIIQYVLQLFMVTIPFFKKTAKSNQFRLA